MPLLYDKTLGKTIPIAEADQGVFLNSNNKTPTT